MLSKIIKHELKLSIKPIAILSGAILVLAILASSLIRSSINNNGTAPNVLIAQLASYATLGMFLCIFACFILLCVVIYRLSYESIYSNEGYLTNVIPIEASSLIIGKLVAVLILVAIISFSILVGLTLYFSIMLESLGLFDFLVDIFQISFTASDIFTIVLVFLMVVSYGVYLITTIFFSSAFFNTTKEKKYPFIFIVVITFAIYFLRNVFESIIQSIFSNLLTNIGTNAYMFFLIFLNCLCIAAFTFFSIKFLDEKVDIS